MKNIALLTLIYICSLNFLCFAQSKNSLNVSAVNEYQNNTKTDNHVNIPFTHIFIDIPSNYRIPKNQTMISKDDITGISVIELDGGNFYTNAARVTKTNLDNQGLTIYEFQEFQLNGNPAIIYLAGSSDKMNKSYQLVTGDSTFSVLLTGYSSPEDSESLGEIKKMMLSFVYDKNHTIDYEAIAPFNYNKNASIFQLASATSTFYTFSINGEKKQKYEDEPFIMVVTFPNYGASPKSLSLKMKNQFQSGGIQLSLIEDSFEEVNGYRAYEVRYKGKQGDQNLELYSLAIMNDEFSIVVQGRINKDYEKMVLEMKKFAHSLTIK